MEVLPSSDNDRQSLEHLLDMFGSVISLQDIASAYCQAERDLHSATDILCTLQSNHKDTSPQYAPFISKSRKGSASLGTVSGVIGRDYVCSRPPANHPNRLAKPPKITCSEFPTMEVRAENRNSDNTSTEVMPQDIAEFLYKMLDGFHLDMGTIQDVVCQCAFDVKKSMEKLLDLSELSFKEDNPIISSKKPLELELELDLDQGLARCRETSSSRAKSRTGNGVKLSENTRDLGKEILNSLFNCPSRIDEPETDRQVQQTRRPRVFGTPVTHPPIEPTETRSFVTRLEVIENSLGDDETGANFEDLKQASKEYFNAMKEYYKAAVEAYVAGDSERTLKLMEEGHFFMKKAREVDEQAAQMLTETRDETVYLSVDLQDFEPRKVVRLLKTHLTSLSGIETFQYLKLVVCGDDEDPRAARRKRVIIKLLKMESIGWSEEDSGKIIVIPLGHIDPKRLSFAK